MALHPTGYKLTQKEHWAALANYYGQKFETKPSNVGAHPGTAQGSSNVRQPDKNFKLSRSPLAMGYLAIVYFGSMFLATFFNVAFYSEIMEALNSRGVSLRRGLGVAFKRLGSILSWTLLAGVVGWVIRCIEERVPLAGRIIMGLIGTAWSVAAVFVIPVIIQDAEQKNPVKILRSSAETLKRTWGEGLIGYAGFSSANTAIFLLSLVPVALVCAVAIHFGSVIGCVIAGGLWLLTMIALSYVSGVASQVYRCVLFVYATDGIVPAPYNHDLLQGAWKVKKG